MYEIVRMTFRLERIIVLILCFTFVKFTIVQWQFWVFIFMFSFVLDKFEDSIRRDYNDSIRARLEQLLKEEMDED